MFRHTLALMLTGFLMLGATFGGEHLSRNSVGSCHAWYITGDNEAENLEDQCRGNAQSARDDMSVVNDADGTDTNVPSGFTSSKRSFDFDGVDDYLTAPDGSMLSWFSVCAWVAPATDGSQAVAGHFEFTVAGMSLLLLDSGPNLKVNAKSGLNGVTTVGDTNVALGGAWTFVCATWDGTSGGTMTVYNSRVSNGSGSIKDCDNGTQTCNEPTADFGNPTTSFLIGIWTFFLVNDFIGQIGEVSGWNPGPLTEAEVCQLCRCGPSNQQVVRGGNRNTTGDRKLECNSCTLPTVGGVQVTHCGPRRIM